MSSLISHCLRRGSNFPALSEVGASWGAFHPLPHRSLPWLASPSPCPLTRELNNAFLPRLGSPVDVGFFLELLQIWIFFFLHLSSYCPF